MRKIFTLPLLLIIFNRALGQVSIPQNINATYSDGQIIIQWDPNPESNLHKYNIYRDTLSAPILLYDSVVNPSLDTFFIDTDITKEKTYYYRITAYDSTGDESGYSDEITIFYSFIPVINNINLWTSQYGNEYGDGDKGVFMQIQVSDPQGLSDIKSVTVTYPDETTYNLNDNGQNGDNNPNDGEYSYHDWSIYGSPLLGAYTFTVIDNSDNSITKTDTLDSFIDYPHNLYPRGNVVITSGTPTLSWDSVPGAASYSIWFGDKNGNHIWGPGNIDTNSIVYNFDASGPALVDGEYYIWHVNAYLNDASSNHNDVRFFYSSETDSPVVANPHIRSRHYGDDEGYEEYGLVLEIDVGDPQGLDDIQSVTVSSPEAEVYILYDDGHHSDWYENDGRFAHHFGGLTDSPPTGDYIYTITDNSSNTVIVTDNLSMVIDYPRNLSPAYNEVVTDSTPLFTWDSIDNINHYWMRVREYEGNTVWGWIDIYDTTITYNEDNNGSDLIDGGIYQWDISTGLDDAESWHHGVRFAYSSIPDIPILSNYDIDARQTIDYYNNEDYYYHFWIDVLDPQGLEEIDSVWIEFPDGSINLLYDDNTHCDGNAGDGRYQYCSGISSPVQTGIYTFYSKDKSGNLASKSDSILVTLNCPNILSPANNSYINEPDFLIEWEKVTEATRYSISVYRHNWGDVWNYNIDSSITSINYSGENLIEGEIYSLYLHAYSLNNWSRTEIRFTYSEQGLITIDGIKDPVWDAATGHIHIDNSFLVDGNSEGDNDCSADVYLVYDSLFLYGFVEVTDDIMGDRNDWWWENDAFKMIFDTDPNTLASIQNANDRINIEFTARVDADDRRHGRNPCLFYRGETANGYIIEFAVSAQALINTSPDPDEQITLEEGTQAGFLFGLADEDFGGREAEFVWGHSSANRNSEGNVSQYGNITLLADNQVQFSQDNLVMDADKPFISSQQLNFEHNTNEHLQESMSLHFQVYVNDPQGLDDIDSVWVEISGGDHYLLYDDNTHCDGDPDDGFYQHCIDLESAPPTGNYIFYVVDNSGNIDSLVDSIPYILNCPNITSPTLNEFVSDPDFLIEWDKVPNATWYDINVYRPHWGDVWNYGVDSSKNSVYYYQNQSGNNLVEDMVYTITITARDNNNLRAYTRRNFIYSEQGLITIDGNKDTFWNTATAHIHLGENEVVWGTVLDQNDCSADIYLAYDSLFLYGLVEVTDDVMGDVYDNWWDDDAFSFLFDVDTSSLASEQNASDLLSIDFSARNDAHDRRDGRWPCIFYRGETGNGYVIEFAVSSEALINTSPDPDETFILEEGTQAGFLFKLADEDDQDNQQGREAEFAWGHISANRNSENNVAQFGSLTLLSDNQIGLSQDNLIMDDNKPFMLKQWLYSNHGMNENLNEYWDFHFEVYLNDPQGLEDIDSVWLEGPDGSRYDLYDDATNCDDYSNDGRYYRCAGSGSPQATGIYTFYAKDKSGNLNSIIDSLPYILDYPSVTSLTNNDIITNSNLLIQWNKIPNATNYWLNVNRHNWGNVWGYSMDSSITSIFYNEDGTGQDLIEGEIYTLQINSRDNNSIQSYTRVKFAYTSQELIIIDGIKETFWDTAIGHIHIDTAFMVSGNSDGDNDCSADVYLAYDSLFLYGFVEVTDDYMGDRYNWWWDNDAFKIIFDTDPNTLASEQNANDRINIEFTARSDADDRRDGRNPCLFYRGETVNGYVIEFAVSSQALINTNPDPDEQFVLEEGSQAGFLFQLADEDEGGGRQAEYAWGHSSANESSEENVSQYGSITLLANNQVQFSQNNLVMDENKPFISLQRLNFNHYLNEHLQESLSMHFQVYVNDPQGLDDIDSVWVEISGGDHYLLYDDNTHCDDEAGNGRYQHCIEFESPPPTGYYIFYVVDNDGNINSVVDSLPYILECPNITSPTINEYVSDPNFLIEWDKVVNATSFYINVYRPQWGDVWNYGWIDSSVNSVHFRQNGSGHELIEGMAYTITITARDDIDLRAYTRRNFIFSNQGLITIDGNKDLFWETATGHIHIDTSNLVWNEWDYNFDCSADVYLAYDSLFLYGYVEVNDDIMGDRYDWWWNNDAFSIIFDTDPNTLASEQNANDRLNIEFTARNDANDRRDGSWPCIFYRGETANGYVIEFAIEVEALINTSPDPDEPIILKEGTQAGFLFKLADEDDINGERGREAEFIWGHLSVNQNSENYLAQYGSITLLADNQIQILHDNLVMGENEPYILTKGISSWHYFEFDNREWWDYHFYSTLNDPQGLDNIDSVWVSCPDGSIYILYDDNSHCDGNANDGNYYHCTGGDSPPNIGIYTFYAKDKSGNLTSAIDSILYNLDCPNITSPINYEFITDPNFIIEWVKVADAMSYSISVERDNWGNVWNYGIDSSITSINYSGQNLIEGEIYSLYLHAHFGNHMSRTHIRFAFTNQSLIVIDGNKDGFWDTATGHIHIGTDELVWGSIQDENDCSADVYLAYDSLFLYGLVEVTDDKMGDVNDWWWDNDAFAFRFDVDPATLASEQNASDIVEIEFTARDDVHDRRNGRGNNLYVRNISSGGYIIEFAVPRNDLINQNTDPDEIFYLEEGTQIGFLFKLADEDDQDGQQGREAEFAWGHESANRNSDNNLAQYGNITLLADNQIQFSHNNLVMNENEPFISYTRLNYYHYLNESLRERWSFHLQACLNDPQGIEDIDSVWVETPDGDYYLLYDDNSHCDGEAGDGYYQHCFELDVPPAAGAYTFYTIDKSSNLVSQIDSLPVALDYPHLITPTNNTYISDPNFLIEWKKVQGANQYWVDVYRSNWNHIWQYWLDTSRNSVYYNENNSGPDLVEGEAYYLQVNARDKRNYQSQIRIKFIFSDTGLIVIDGIKDSFWNTATGYIHLGTNEVVWGSISNESDCSADVYLAYDSLFLYGFIEVTDDKMGDVNDWWWDNDAFAIRIDVDPTTLASEQDASDVIGIEFTARNNANDQRNGRENNLYARSIFTGGYIIEFAVPGNDLINYSPDPDEEFVLEVGTQVGFLFELADEDDQNNQQGRSAVLVWGHESANSNSSNNVSHFGHITLLANNQIQPSNVNLIVDPNLPYIQIAEFSSSHNVNEYSNEYWDINMSVFVNDQQGLDDIQAVWVIGPSGTRYNLYDNGQNCDEQSGDGRYTFCNSYNASFATGDYTFYVIDKSGNQNSITENLPDFLDIPANISPSHNSIVSEPDFIIDWDEVPGADNYRINMARIEDGWDDWFWGTGVDQNQTSYNYNGDQLELGRIYKIQISAGKWRTSSGNQVRFAYRTNTSHTIYVNQLNISGIEDGTAEFPYNTIREAINSTVPGDTVLVFPGNYMENIQIGNKENIILASLFLTTRDTSYVSKTIINGDRDGSVISISDCQDTIEITGLSLTNGAADNGGGIGGWNSNIILNYLKIYNNMGNSSGGGIHFNNCNVTMYNSLITDNTTDNAGGGFSVCCNGTYNLFNCKISNNYAPNIVSGIGIRSWDCDINIYNSLLANNSGGASIDYSNVTGSIINCTVADNPDGSFAFNDSYIEVRNCIEWGNNQNRWGNLNNIQYSNIEGGIAGTGNINVDPMFVNATSGDYRLKLTSPCIDAGTPDASNLNLPVLDLAGNIRINGTRIDMGAYEYREKITNLIQYINTEITIDGLIDDIWQGIEIHNIDKNFINETPTLDLATWQAVWNDTAIFVLVRVEEDDFFPDYEDYSSESWWYDKPEIYFDVNEELNDGQGPVNQNSGHYQVAPNFVEDYNQYIGDDFAYQGNIYAYCGYTVNENNYNYEYSIRLADFIDQNGDTLDPYTIDEIGFDVYIIDRDAGDPGRKRAVWKNTGGADGSAESWNNMDECGTIMFVRPDNYHDLNVEIITNKSSICPNEEVHLQAIASGGTGIYTYTWTSNPPDITFLFNNPVVSPTVTTTYSVSVSDGERTVEDSVTITVYQLPVVNAGEDTIIALNQKANLHGTATGGSGNYLYSWSPSDSVNNSFIKNPTTLSLKRSNLFILSATDYLSGCENTDQVLVMVSGGPLGANIYSSKDTLCEGESIQLQAIPTGGTGNYTYSWRSDPAGFSSTLLNPVDYPSDTTTYYFDLIDAAITKTASKTIVVSLVSPPSVPDALGCFEDPTPPLIAQGTNIKWYSDSLLKILIGTGNTYQPIDSTIGEYYFYATQTNHHHCISPKTEALLSINEKPEVTVSASTNPIYINGSSLLSAGGAIDYEWLPPDGLNKTTGSMVEASPSENTTYTVIGTDENTCSDDTSITLYVYCEKCKLNNLYLFPEGIITHGCTNNVYQNNSNCSWIIYPSGAKSIYLKFDTIDIKPGDYIRIYNGLNETGTLLGEYNNDTIPAGQLKSGPGMFIQFYSNESETGLGFSARYRINEPVVGIIEQTDFISDLIIYPNPVNGHLYIEFNTIIEEKIILVLYNSLGKIIILKEIYSEIGENREILDLNNVYPGLYYLRISSIKGNAFRKIIIY